MKTVIKKWLPAPKKEHETIEISDPIELLEKYVTGYEDEKGKCLILDSLFNSDTHKYHLLYGKDFTVGGELSIDYVIGILSIKENTVHTFQDYEEAVKWVNKDK